MLYSEIDDYAPNPYEIPVAVQKHSSNDFEFSEVSLPTVEEQSWRRMSVATISQPALEQNVRVCACVCLFSTHIEPTYLILECHDGMLCTCSV